VAVNMRDVARVAGVSQRTVSNVVNGYVHVKPETRARVQQAIDTLNFRPNISAQKLRKGRTGLVALAVPEIAAPYFAELADHLQRYAADRGITLLMDQTGGTRQRELLVLDGYRSNIIDGLILSPLAITAEDLAHRPLDVPVVLLGESIDSSGFLHVSVDNVAAAKVATEHLISSGRRQIAAVGAHFSVGITGPAERRLQGYIEATSAAGLLLSPALTFKAKVWTKAQGYAIATDIVAKRSQVDALFCFNDSLALGAIRALHELGVHVPDDIAVVGWDDIEEASYSTPTLTTIAPDKEQITTRAIDGLLASINKSAVVLEDVTCPFELKIRESTAG
jgi:DNA-binding LacI/PurR family transcriptional regulator